MGLFELCRPLPAAAIAKPNSVPSFSFTSSFFVETKTPEFMLAISAVQVDTRHYIRLVDLNGVVAPADRYLLSGECRIRSSRSAPGCEHADNRRLDRDILAVLQLRLVNAQRQLRHAVDVQVVRRNLARKHCAVRQGKPIFQMDLAGQLYLERLSGVAFFASRVCCSAAWAFTICIASLPLIDASALPYAGAL